MAYRAEFDSPAGYAVRRRGSCLADKEFSCGKTWGNFSACCPSGTKCPSKNSDWKNSICCPKPSNCFQMLQKRPHCANETWNMFEHKNSYFCCQQGLDGFWNGTKDSEGFGCGRGKPGYKVLGPVGQVRGDPASSQISGGAIAGAVVGAVAGVVIIIGLIWFFIRRRRQARAQAQPPSPLQEDGRTPSPMYSKLDNTQPSELHDEPAKESTRPHELDSVTPRELDGQNTSVEIGDKSPVELPAAVR